jgi:hypothetical protein
MVCLQEAFVVNAVTLLSLSEPFQLPGDTSPTAVSQAQHYQTWPHVAWNGENWLVAWTTERESDP